MLNSGIHSSIQERMNRVPSSFFFVMIKLLTTLKAHFYGTIHTGVLLLMTRKKIAGSFLEATVNNPFTATRSCPNNYQPHLLGRDVQICTSSDQELGASQSVGFFSCSVGNPLISGPNEVQSDHSGLVLVQGATCIILSPSTAIVKLASVLKWAALRKTLSTQASAISHTPV